MINCKQVMDAIEEGKIEIYVSFYMKDNVLKLYEPELALLSSSLKGNLYSDRLKLTMGPIVKILDKKSFKPKYRFKSTQDCYDLRKSDNKYIIKPGESIVVLTNERIKLNGKYACIIVPRTSLSDVGIVTTTAYVDPYYFGVMRLHISNLSDKSFELRSLEAIAQCFFFEFSEDVPDLYKEQFSAKSVFFGQTWQGILGSDREPFPIKKQSTNIDKFSNIKYQWDIIWSFIKKHSLIFFFLTNFVIFAGGLLVIKQNYTKYINFMEQVEEILEPSSSEIIILPGKTYGEKEVTVAFPKSDIVSVLCNNDEIHYKILSGDVENETTIVFSYSLVTKQEKQYEMNFTYIIVRRID